MKDEKEIKDCYSKWKQIYNDELNTDEFKSHIKVMLNTFEYCLNVARDFWTK